MYAKVYSVAGIKTAATLISARLFASSSFLPEKQERDLQDFIGLNVSTGLQPETDDYVIEKLTECKILQVRVDLSADEKGGPKERFIHRLQHEGFKTCIRLMQSPVEAAQIHSDKAVQLRWSIFLSDCKKDFKHENLEAFEIGATPNRRKWSGYWYSQYLEAWSIAHTNLSLSGIKLVGPTVSDFEPLYDLFFLHAMKGGKALPTIHGVNLFCERTKTPEVFDERVLGKSMSKVLKLNLIKKANIFADISRRFKLEDTWCMHTCWNSERVARWSDNTEVDRADYLKRYLECALDSKIGRVYWGPLIGYPDGLIYDAEMITHGLERVAHYPLVSDNIDSFTETESFKMLKTIMSKNENKSKT